MNRNIRAGSLLLVGFGLLMAVFGLAQGLTVRHPSAPVFLILGVVGLLLAVYGVIRLSKSAPPTE